MTNYLSFIRLQWPLITFGFLSVFWGNIGQSFFLSWFGADIQRELSISAAQYGLYYAVGTLASSAVIMIIGGMVDKYPPRLLIVILAVFLALACVLMAQLSSVLMLCVTLFLLRLCGQGLLPHTAQTIMIRSFEKQRGKAISLASSGVAVGEAILPSIIIALIAWLGWRHSWYVFAASVLVLYLPLGYWLLVKSALQKAPVRKAKKEEAGDASGRRDVLKDWRFWLILPTSLAAPFLVTGVFIQQNFLLEQKMWSSALLASGFIAYGVSHWFSAMVAGSLVDKFSAKSLLLYLPMPLLAALIILVIFDGAWSVFVFMTLFGTGIGALNTVINAAWAEIYGTKAIGSIRAMMTSLMIFATAASPLLFGLMIEQGWNDTQLFGLLAWGMLLVSILNVPAYLSFKKR
ncbi:MFS transporter [Marinomonas sp. M1K-6]|uniref:MFS transporter n=1 Tax=Marinomonas profundi TaxID=2726122 RepID=A0A847QUW7_9GAMM|nr:MFS transporter [Marinomonas profundi]NLQ16418.1 MFS transporter [Marinomonas profundi]UDV03009.1 MFS transporter [Marinomonas profundi]